MARARRTSWVWIVFAAVIGAMLITAATFVAVRLTAALPRLTIAISVPDTLVVGPSGTPAIPVPTRGSFALATSMDGTVATRDPSGVHPIGSVAKAMTALIVACRSSSSDGDMPTRRANRSGRTRRLCRRRSRVVHSGGSGHIDS